MRSLAFLGIFLSAFLTGCAPQGTPASAPKEVQIGTMSEADLRSLKGPPRLAVASPLDASTTLYEYENQERYQVQNKKITARFRNPTEAESHLYFWKLHAGKQKTKDDLVEDGHLSRRQFTIPSLGIGVSYDPSTARVIRVFEFEKKP